MEVLKMSKRKQDPSKTGLSSAHVEGQGTTTEETGAREASSSRKKQKRS
jgi:YuzL-like protein